MACAKQSQKPPSEISKTHPKQVHVKKMQNPNEEVVQLNSQIPNERTNPSVNGGFKQKLAALRNLFGLRTLFLVAASISLGFLISATVIDTHIVTSSSRAVNFPRLEEDVALPDSRIGPSSISVVIDGKDRTYKYSDLSHIEGKDDVKSINDKSIEIFLSSDLGSVLGFRLPITSIEYASTAGALVSIFQIISVAFTGLAIVLQLLFRQTPDSFILKPAVTSKFSLSRVENLKSGLPGFCLLLSVVFIMITTVITSSYIHNMVYRLIAYGIFNSGADDNTLSLLRIDAKGKVVAAKKVQLQLMQFIGSYLHHSDIVYFGFSFYASLIAMGINLAVFFSLFYRDNRIARLALANAASNAAPPSSQAVEERESAMEAQWKALPWHCRVRPIWVSSIICLVGFTVTAIGGNVARRRGVKMNRYPFEVDGGSRSFIDDVVISRTEDYFFSTAGIVDAAVMVFMPILVTVAISSYDKVRFGSKFLELLGLIFFMRGISVMATIMPTLFNVLQHPQCWDQPGTSLKDMLAEKEFCNDLMFSGHTVFAFLPAMIFVYSIIYGPYSYKPFLVGTVLFTATGLSSLIVVGRLHYTADVVVAIVITTLLVTMNAPVWKLQFSFRKAQIGGSGSALSAIEKVPSYLELCIERLNVFTVAVQESGFAAGADEAGSEKHSDTWRKIDDVYAQLGDLIDQIGRDQEDPQIEEETKEEDIDTITAVFGDVLPAAEAPVSLPQEEADDKKPLINKA